MRKRSKSRVSRNASPEYKLTLDEASATPRSEKPSRDEQTRDTNRDTWGTWNKSYDFTLTVIGNVMGIHNFWRFPYLCYTYGGAFFIAFLVILIFVGIPIVFMEFTIGQYFSIGPPEAFGQMAPAFTGVSYIMAWNAMMTCMLYVMMISFSRFYTSVASSCNKAWESCNKQHYYNTPECFTGEEDDLCDDIAFNSSAWTYEHQDRIYYNFTCIEAKDFCGRFDALYAPSSKTCYYNNSRRSFSIYERRTNAATEHFYGGICGLQRKRDVMRSENRYNQTKAQDFQEGRELVTNKESHSGINLKLYTLTTWLLLAIFLYEGLLAVSGVTYLFGTLPFVLMIIFTAKALNFSQAITGIEEFTLNRNFLKDFTNINMWAEAGIQVICTMGIGTGCLITLATFNKYQYQYLFDACFTSFLIFLVSGCASIICFCTIGHYINYYRINVPFDKYLHSESSSSSIEFGFIVYTHFLTLLHNEEYTIIMFFFMLTSFGTDSALRLVQMTLDTAVSIFPSLRRRRFTALLGICALGFVAQFFLSRNGGLIKFLEFEYFTISFVSPLVAFIEVVTFAWIFGARKIASMAEEMKITSSRLFRWYFIFGLKYLAPLILSYVLVVKLVFHTRIRFNKRPSSWNSEIFFWFYTSIPIMILLIKIWVQACKIEKPKCRNLFHVPTEDKAISGTTLLLGLAKLSYDPDRFTPTVYRAAEKWRKSADRFHLIPNAPLRKRYPSTPEDNDISRAGRASRFKNFRDASVATTWTTPSRAKSVIGFEDEVIAMDYTQGTSRWKRFLLYILSYFEQWPGRFDEDSNEEEESDDDGSLSGTSDGNRRNSPRY